MENDEQGMLVNEDEARAGVTGHNVRYVLAFGLAGVIAAFAAIGIYNGYDRLAASLSQAFSRDPVAVLMDSAPYVLAAMLGITGAYLLLSLWSLLAGPTDNATQTGMRARVVTQFTVICAIMAGLYLAAG